MNGNKLILDSNILIYLSQSRLKLSNFAQQGDYMMISVITYMEALGYNFSNKDEEDIISKLCQELVVLPIGDAVVNEVIQIRQAHKIKLPDAIIGATGIVNGATLVTHNTADFKSLQGKLKMVDPL